jgi:hypothetical protein
MRKKKEDPLVVSGALKPIQVSEQPGDADLKKIVKEEELEPQASTDFWKGQAVTKGLLRQEQKFKIDQEYYSKVGALGFSPTSKCPAQNAIAVLEKFEPARTRFLTFGGRPKNVERYGALIAELKKLEVPYDMSKFSAPQEKKQAREVYALLIAQEYQADRTGKKNEDEPGKFEKGLSCAKYLFACIGIGKTPGATQPKRLGYLDYISDLVDQDEQQKIASQALLTFGS